MKKSIDTLVKLSKVTSLSTLLLFAVSILMPNALTSQTTTQSFSFTGTIQTWTVPNGVTSVELEVTGGDGGDGNMQEGGSGAKATATFPVTPGTVLEIVIGGAGASSTANGGGGGGSGVRIQGAAAPLIVAGGGAGGARGSSSRSMAGGGGVIATGNGNGGDEGGTNGSGGGGGLLTDGNSGSLNGGTGGKKGFGADGGIGFGGLGNGGFGVGGGGGGGDDAIVGGGGGGGYSGGDASLTGSKIPNFSTGGGSFIDPSATSFRSTGASSSRNSMMPIVAGVMGGNANPPANGMIMFNFNAVSAPIPTLNQWSLLIFGLLLLNLSLIFIRQKSRI